MLVMLCFNLTRLIFLVSVACAPFVGETGQDSCLVHSAGTGLGLGIGTEVGGVSLEGGTDPGGADIDDGTAPP